MPYILGLLSIGIAFATNVSVLQFGWGLQPVSWAWIFVGFFSSLFFHALARVLEGISKSGE